MAELALAPITNYQLYNLNHDAELPSLPYSIGGSFRRYGWLAGIKQDSRQGKRIFFAKCDTMSLARKSKRCALCQHPY